MFLIMKLLKKRSKYEKQIFKNFEKTFNRTVQANDINFYLQNDILVKVDRSVHQFPRGPFSFFRS